MKAEALIGSFTVYSDDGQHAITVVQRIGGVWWGDVQRAYAFGWERIRSVRLYGALDLGALVVATFGIKDSDAAADRVLADYQARERIDDTGELNVDVEPIEPVEIRARQYGDDERDAKDCPELVGNWWWVTDAYATSTPSRGVLATAEDARADAIAYLRELRERIDLTLAGGDEQ